jgi:phage N-6-adenine-methyltransferase
MTTLARPLFLPQLELFGSSARRSLPSDERYTPQKLFSPLAEEFSFTLDACSAPVAAKCPRFYSAADDGLVQPWTAERVWCNPPWSGKNPALWVQKAWFELQRSCPLVVMLFPDNRCHQAWWQHLVEPWRDRTTDGITLRTRFHPGRVHFGSPSDPQAIEKGHPRFGVCLLVFRREIA